MGKNGLARSNHQSVCVELHRTHSRARFGLPPQAVLQMWIPTQVSEGEEQSVGARVDVFIHVAHTICGRPRIPWPEDHISIAWRRAILSDEDCCHLLFGGVVVPPRNRRGCNCESHGDVCTTLRFEIHGELMHLPKGFNKQRAGLEQFRELFQNLSIKIKARVHTLLQSICVLINIQLCTLRIFSESRA